MALKENIQAAFSGVTYPGDENITHCPYKCFECTAVAAFFKGKKWQEISTSEARHYHGALNVFTPEAFQFFLPAFMLASVEAYDRQDIIPDSIRVQFEFILEHKDYFAQKISNFTPLQKKTITEFLRSMESRGAGSSEDAIGLLNEDPAES